MLTSKNNICFIVLGHEINQNDFILSDSGKKRCEVLNQEVKKHKNDDILILFMGLGRKQGECPLSISECMLKYYLEKHKYIPQYFLDKNSLDSVGDAIFSKEILSNKKFKGKVKIITSDWHCKRAKIIFDLIYKDQYEISLSKTSEINYMDDNQIKTIMKREENSTKVFIQTFLNFNHNEPIPFLKAFHKLYQDN